MTSFYTNEELLQLGFQSVGHNVLISKKASLYGVSRISIGNHVRIDDFCVISAGKGGIQMGNYIHIAVYVSVQGDGKITLEDFSGLSSKVAVYSSNDDYSGAYMSNPTVPAQFTNVTHAPVTIGKHALVGSGAIILPGVTVHEGAVVGALSLVNNDCEAFYIYVGAPAKKRVARSKNLLNLEKDFLKTLE